MSLSLRAAPISLCLMAAAFAAETAPTLSKKSPFEAVNAPVAQAAASETIEFAGVSTVGKKTELIFHDKTAKKNHWIANGETKEGISVVAYDERREQAHVKINGAEKILPLRKGANTTKGGPRPVTTLPAASGFAQPAVLPAIEATQKTAPGVDLANVPAPQTVIPASPQPAAPATPEAQAQQKAETEARMLVSDLLEIGMAQRKAYEEAQRKAAEGNSAQNATPATTATPETPKP